MNHEQITNLLEITSLMLFSGIYGTLFGLRWATKNLDDRAFAETLQRILPPLSKGYPPLAFAGLASSVALSISYLGDALHTVLGVLASISVVVFMVITVRGNVPINEDLTDWNLEDLPSGWKESLRKWHAYNNLRTNIGTAGLFCLVLAVALST